MTARIVARLSALALVVAVAVTPAAPRAVAAQDSPPACATPAPSGDPLTISGNGRSNSAPFALDGGAYRVDWGMRKPGTGAQGASLQLLAADADDLSRWRLIVRSPSLGANGDVVDETYVYTIKPGPYFIKADVPGEWFVRLTPIVP